MNKYEQVKKYIADNFDKTVRYNPKGDESLIGLPFKYTVPCIKDIFNELYYWDTYFTNKGLLLCGKVELAKSNCDNMAYLINKYGYMPNGNRAHFLLGSQPPYFALMVDDVYEVIKDKKWLEDMYQAIVKEYHFWNSLRKTPTGLNRHGTDRSDKQCIAMIDYVLTRIKIDLNRAPLEVIGRHMYAEAESGWDFSPRFDQRCMEFNPVDLNSLLYRYEILLAKYENELDIKSDVDWLILANKRKELINTLCFNKESGVYTDYDYVNNKATDLITCAGFWPFYCGLVDKDNNKPLYKLLDNLEKEYGLSACNKYDDYQWGHNKSWAPLNYVGIVSLEKYGLHNEAINLALKYVNLIADCFINTGGLWEKYNSSTGKVVEGVEYETPQMLGWTAGTYLAVLDFLYKNKAI